MHSLAIASLFLALSGAIVPAAARTRVSAPATGRAPVLGAQVVGSVQERTLLDQLYRNPDILSSTIAEIMEEHVTFELESIDRLYLNGYVAGLQTPEAVAHFLRKHRGARFASDMPTS